MEKLVLIGDNSCNGMPRTWIDTFAANKAFEDHGMSLLIAMNEIREEKKAEKQANIDRAVSLAETYKMLGIRKNN